jgi:hypothetical protein
MAGLDLNAPAEYAWDEINTTGGLRSMQSVEPLSVSSVVPSVYDASSTQRWNGMVPSDARAMARRCGVAPSVGVALGAARWSGEASFVEDAPGAARWNDVVSPVNDALAMARRSAEAPYVGIAPAAERWSGEASFVDDAPGAATSCSVRTSVGDALGEAVLVEVEEEEDGGLDVDLDEPAMEEEDGLDVDLDEPALDEGDGFNVDLVEPALGQGDGLNLNEPPLEHGTTRTSQFFIVCVMLHACMVLFRVIVFQSLLFVNFSNHSSLVFLWTGFDLNLPLDEFGAVDFDYFQNSNGK